MASANGARASSGRERRREPRTPIDAPSTPGSDRATLYGAFEVNASGAKRSRVERELASLAPWAWDPRAGTHAPGPSALRDFSEVVADKVIAASASGRIDMVRPKTFDRTLLSGDEGKKTKGGREETPAPRTAPERAEGSKRPRAAAVTPVALSEALDDVAVSAKKPTRMSERAKAVKQSEQPVIRAVTEKENHKQEVAAKRAMTIEKIAARKPLKDSTLNAMNGATIKEVSQKAKVEYDKPAAVIKAPKTRQPATKTPDGKIASTPRTDKSLQTPVAKQKSNVVEDDQKAAIELSTRRTVSSADALRESVMLEMVLAKTYVKALSQPIIPSAKPSKRLLEAYRAFSRACATNRKVENVGTSESEKRSFEPGVALKRGLDTLRAEDDLISAA